MKATSTLKNILFTVFTVFVLFTTTIKAQTLTFCESIDSNGDPVTTATSFIIPADGGYFYFYVKLGKKVNSTEIHYNIYSIDNNSKEIFEKTIYQDVETDWAYFYKKMTFYHTGDYMIYVYDKNSNFLASGKVRVKS